MAKKTKAKPKASSKAAKSFGAFSAASFTLAAAARTAVTFTCSSAVCLVSIQLGLTKTTFVGSGTMNMPSGNHMITWQVQGPAGVNFTLTAAGATMNQVAGVASASGLQPITVP